jgi:ribosomal subunit interface protein
MSWTVRGLNVDASDSLRSYAMDKIASALHDLVDHATSVVVRFHDEDVKDLKSPRRAQAVVVLDGRMFVAEDKQHSDLYAAVDRLSHRIRRQINDYVARRRDRRRRFGRV